MIESPPGGIPAGTLIVVTVVDIRGDRVRLGFEAPKPIPIDRDEVREAKKSGEMKPRAKEAA